MQSALLVTSNEKSIEFFTEMLSALCCHSITTAATCGEARRMLIERSFDLCIINSPLKDESGEALSRYIAEQSLSQVILVVKSEHYEAVSAIVEALGVITVSKPVSKAMFWSALKFAKAMHGKICAMKSENSKLARKIEDIRIVDRAKCILISYLGMTEPQAHKFIEKQAMDLRLSKRSVAEDILKTYES